MRKIFITLALSSMILFSGSAFAQNVEYVGSYDTPDWAEGVFVSDSYVYMSIWLTDILAFR